jgi:hypothetical protein
VIGTAHSSQLQAQCMAVVVRKYRSCSSAADAEGNAVL